MGSLIRRRLFSLLLVIALLRVGADEWTESDDPQVNEFVLHPEKIDSFWYRASMKALLKAKYKVLATQVDTIDRVIYADCEREAKTVVKQAKCLIKLLDARDRKQAERTASSTRSKFSVFDFGETNEDNPLKVLLKAIVDTNWKMFGKLMGKTEEKTPPTPPPPFRKRKKRAIADHANKEDLSHLPRSIQNLRKIERYLRLADYSRDYMHQLNEENAMQLDRLNVPTRYEVQPPSPHSAFSTINNFLEGAPFDRLSILSPRLMSLFPTSGDGGAGRPRLLSPDLLSIHEEGSFPLPNVLRLALGDEREVHAWVDILLRITGASKQLDRMLVGMKDEMKQMEERVYPAVLKLEERDEQWLEFEARQSEEQRRQLEQHGFTFMEPEQAGILFDTIPDYVHYTPKQKEYQLEKRIREWAQLDERILDRHTAAGGQYRKKRQLPTPPPPPLLPGVSPPPDFNQLKAMLGLPSDFGESPDAEHGEPKVVVLEPWTNSHRLGGFVALEVGLVVLSPSIGAPKVQSPESLTIVVLSPSIMSPHIMSDGMLNVEILSPHLLSGHDEHDKHDHKDHHKNHTSHPHCCNAMQRKCCSKGGAKKHESHSHFNQFVHSSTQNRTVGQSKGPTKRPASIPPIVRPPPPSKPPAAPYSAVHSPTRGQRPLTRIPIQLAARQKQAAVPSPTRLSTTKRMPMNVLTSVQRLPYG